MVGIFMATVLLVASETAGVVTQQHESAKKENPKSLPTLRGLESRATTFALSSRRGSYSLDSPLYKTTVGIFMATDCLSHQKPQASSRSNMNLRKRRTPRASQHYVGWRVGQQPLLFPVAGEVFPLTLPFIERAYGNQ